jgi:hypothetical protein
MTIGTPVSWPVIGDQADAQLAEHVLESELHGATIEVPASRGPVEGEDRRTAVCPPHGVGQLSIVGRAHAVGHVPWHGCPIRVGRRALHGAQVIDPDGCATLYLHVREFTVAGEPVGT